MMPATASSFVPAIDAALIDRLHEQACRSIFRVIAVDPMNEAPGKLVNVASFRLKGRAARPIFGPAAAPPSATAWPASARRSQSRRARVKLRPESTCLP